MPDAGRPAPERSPDRADDHPWWRHAAAGQKRTLLGMRISAWLRRRNSRIIAMGFLYLLLCAIPLVFGGASISLLAVLPMLLLPALAGLTWWLIWKEFHH
jgi:hypothetical protein